VKIDIDRSDESDVASRFIIHASGFFVRPAIQSHFFLINCKGGRKRRRW